MLLKEPLEHPNALLMVALPDGNWTLVGYHPDGSLTPSSFESYDAHGDGKLNVDRRRAASPLGAPTAMSMPAAMSMC